MRANVHLGGNVEPYTLQEVDQQILENISEKINSDGLYFCGLDIMGPEEEGNLENTKLLELNVRCPGSIESLESLVKRYREKEAVRESAARKIVEFAENLRESKRQ